MRGVVARGVLFATGLDRVRQENEGTGQADSNRYQLDHRTHHGRASPRGIKGALPFQDMAWKNGLATPPPTDAGVCGQSAGPATLLHPKREKSPLGAAYV